MEPTPEMRQGIEGTGTSPENEITWQPAEGLIERRRSSLKRLFRLPHVRGRTSLSLMPRLIRVVKFNAVHLRQRSGQILPRPPLHKKRGGFMQP